MKKTLQIINNEEGSLIAIVLLLMAVLTVIGISASNTAITESQIVRNETSYKTSFFRAEAAAIEAIQRLQDEMNLDVFPPTYLMPIGTITTPNQLLDRNDPAWGFAEDSGLDGPTTDVEFLAVSTGIQTGSSMAMGAAQVHSYVVYGREQDARGGDVIVGIGYTKPF
ncbi:MAG: pilus assembly PilX N-terminal domain-containing protein [Pseudomonadota bacterium]